LVESLLGVIFAVDPSIFSFDLSVPWQDVFILNYLTAIVACVSLHARLTAGKELSEDWANGLFLYFGTTLTLPFAAVFGKVASSRVIFAITATIFWFVFVFLVWRPFREILAPHASDGS